jgi:type II restriction/modification system DNA methylase subunit YeeA
MNTNLLKRFAQTARRKLIEQVGAKLELVINTDSAELREKTEQLKKLQEAINSTSKQQVIDKVAYTWFNRLMALRFMDANDFQPNGVRVITPKEGYTLPELLDEAKQGHIPDDLPVKAQHIYDVLDGKVPSTNPQNEAYKELLIGACNHLHKVFPFLFERINDYTELLMPDDLISEFSIVQDIRDGMTTKDCHEVEVIGWLYQFYISEKKDELINAKKRYKANEIAPVTQLFTPKWIVQYMVDNSLGQLWSEARKDSKITNSLEFYIKPNNPELIPERNIASIEDVKFFDPCVGSGHILCYAFDLFYKIYEEEGYNPAEIPNLIITKNLFGIDIDNRASQLAGFALMMKARQKHRRYLRKAEQPNITHYQNFNNHPKFENAQVLGSLIKINSDEANQIEVDSGSLYGEQNKELKRQALMLSDSYDVVVTNPPYLNASYMEGTLKQYIEKEFKSTKSDLFASFVIQCKRLTKQDGLIGFISPYVWMFISSYERLREEVIRNSTISSLVQLEYNAFEPACVPIATFTLRNRFVLNYKGSYIKLSDFTGHENQAPRTLEAIQNPNCGWFFTAHQKDFEKIPASPIGYWLENDVYKIFDGSKPLDEYFEARKGLTTSNDARFLKNWYEVSLNKTSINTSPNTNSFNNKKFYPINKGGGFRRWYGNFIAVCDWEREGEKLKQYKKAYIRSENNYFKSGVTWNAVSTLSFCCRYVPEGFLFNDVGPTIFNVDHPLLLMSYLNSSHADLIFKVLCPTMKFEVGQIQIFPLPVKLNSIHQLEKLGKECVKAYKEDWDSNELSWDYKKNILLIRKMGEDVEEAINSTEFFLRNKYSQQIKVENQINLEISTALNISKRNVETDTITLYEQILPNENLNIKELIQQYISYAVGCMFGRYSLDKEGLILANQRETFEDYLKAVALNEDEVSFLPDDDNIIPVLDADWFEDDIVGRFYQFLKVSFGAKSFDKNLAFVEECLGKDIRKYFMKDFYTDHIKRYKKRPIYWMFSSPKASFNVLIYMHRYTPDTLNQILNGYLKEYKEKLNTHMEHLDHVIVTGSSAEQTKASKEKDKLKLVLLELQEYERDVLYPLATERIAIDLDDGVLVNYNKFGNAIKPVPGLNDKKTKKKVREFDWIDVETIRD